MPQLLQSRMQTLQEATQKIEKQKARLLEVFLAEVIDRNEFERKRQELEKTDNSFKNQLQQLQKEAQKQINIKQIAQGIEGFCRRTGQTLDQLEFQQRRQLIELLVDRVVVDDQSVEIRYVIPTSPKGEKNFFCQLRLDHFKLIAPFPEHQQSQEEL